MAGSGSSRRLLASTVAGDAVVRFMTGPPATMLKDRARVWPEYPIPSVTFKVTLPIPGGVGAGGYMGNRAAAGRAKSLVVYR
eukprot:1865962-Prymnesium_polylepis.1